MFYMNLQSSLVTRHHLLKLIFFALIFALYVYMRIPGLGQDITNSDAIRWHRRSNDFLTAIKHLDFKNTYQRYHPGVTIMWSNALAKQAVLSYDSMFSTNPGELTIENTSYYVLIHRISKTFQVLLLSILFLIMLIVVTKVFSAKVGMLFGFLFALEPYLIGIDRWFHLTSFEAYFGFISFLLVLYWKQASGRRNTILILSGIFFSLACLSKVTASIIFPLLIAIIYLESHSSTQIIFKKSFFIFLAAALVTVLLLFPALWYSPIYTLGKVMNGVRGGVYEDIRENTLVGINVYFYYLYILVFKLSPMTLLLFLSSLWANFQRSRISKEDFYKTFAVLIYFLTYLLVLSLSVKKIDRYLIALIPPLLLYISIFLQRLNPKNLFLILAGVLLFTFAAKSSFAPVYSAYYSPLFGTSPSYAAYDKGFYNNSGEYFAQAAFTMNNIVDRQKVWVPYNRDSFDFYFKRDTFKDFDGSQSFAVVSIDHLEEGLQQCSELLYTFGPKKEAVVFVLHCP